MVSLLDVQTFYGTLLCTLTSYFGKTESLCEAASLSGTHTGFIDPATLKGIVSLSLHEMKNLCNRMGLGMTLAYIERIEGEIKPGKSVALTVVQGWMRTLQERLEDELQTELLFHVGKERANFYNYGNCERAEISTAFPLSFGELACAGRCIAYGEGTACVFHLMRVLDYGFRSVANSLEITYDARNWMGLSSSIEKKLEVNYKEKSPDWRASEPFYASVLTNMLAISRAHRNPVLHELEHKYTEAEAESLFRLTDGFIFDLAKHGMREKP